MTAAFICHHEQLSCKAGMKQASLDDVTVYEFWFFSIDVYRKIRNSEFEKGKDFDSYSRRVFSKRRSVISKSSATPPHPRFPAWCQPIRCKREWKMSPNLKKIIKILTIAPRELLTSSGNTLKTNH